MDIGTSIKEAIYDVGRQNMVALESIASSQKEIASSQKEMGKSLNEIKDILGTHTTILENLEKKD